MPTYPELLFHLGQPHWFQWIGLLWKYSSKKSQRCGKG